MMGKTTVEPFKEKLIQYVRFFSFRICFQSKIVVGSYSRAFHIFISA